MTNSERWWLWGCVLSTGILAWIGLRQPGAALRAAVIAGLLLAALVLVRAVTQLFTRIPLVDDSAVVAPEPKLGPATLEGYELPSNYSGLAPSKAASPVLAPGARSALRTIATERLWARHQLNVWHAAHEPLITQLVSDRLWVLINPNQRTPPPPEAFDHALLRQHLDELDAL